MKIESKISGWRIDDCDIKTIPNFGNGIVTIAQIDNLSMRSAQWIFDHYNLIGLNKDKTGSNFGVVLSPDDLRKVSIMEYHPDIEKELKDYFNPYFGDWRKCYLRFGH